MGLTRLPFSGNRAYLDCCWSAWGLIRFFRNYFSTQALLLKSQLLLLHCLHNLNIKFHVESKNEFTPNDSPEEDISTIISPFQGYVSVLEYPPKTGLHSRPWWRAWVSWTPENTSQERAALCFDKNILFNQRIVMIFSPNLFVPKSPLVD